MRFSHRVSLLLAIALPNGAVRGQAVVQIPGTPTCNTCKVTLTPIAVLKAPDTAEPLGPGTAVMDSAGRFYVVSANRLKISAFDARGKFIREIGTRGQGPGEWNRVSAVSVGHADSLLVIENSRLTVFAPSLAYVRSAALPLRLFGLIPMQGSQLVGRGRTGPGDYNAHTIDGERLVRSFGWDALPTPDRRCMACSDQRVLPGPTDRTVWIAAPNRYDIERWNIDGQREAHIIVDGADWFQPWSVNPSVGDGVTPKSSMLLAAYSDASGRLLVSGIHSPPTWKPHPLPAGMSSAGGGIAVRGTPEQLNDYIVSADTVETETVIDVLDIAKKTLLLRFRYPGSLYLLNASVAVQSKLDDDGNIVHHVFRLSLTEKTP